jgi:hypothetical protein
MPTLHLYRFRYLDPVHNKWLNARYVAEREVIALRHTQFEIIEPPEVREVPDDPCALGAGHLAGRTPGESAC